MYQVNTRGKRRRSALPLCCAILLSVVLTPHAQAAFIDAYALSNFALTNTSTCAALDMPNGFVTGSADNLSIILTGSNSGSGCAGTTDLTITAAGAGVVQFDYSYSSLDTPGFDSGGFLLGAVFTELTEGNPPLSGTQTIQVTAGETFGFRVTTADNQGEPGVLTISNFSAPAGSTTTPAPEPGTLGLVVVSVLGGLMSLPGSWRKEARQ